MAKVPDILYQGQPTTNIAALYTVGTGKKSTITGITACNTSTNLKYFSLYLVQQGDAAADDVALAKMQKLVSTDNAGGGGVWTYQFPIPLNSSGDAISGVQETAGAITMTMIGFEEDA